MLAAAAPAANAQDGPPPPTLTNESFEGVPTVTINCNPTGKSSGSFEVSGVAAGPYPGTFHEEGTFSFGPQTPQVPAEDLTFEATFTINSLTGRVTGTKRVLFPNTGPVAFCAPAGANSSGTVAHNTVYEATITTPTGTFTDRGNANGAFNFVAGVGTDFSERFQSDFLVAQCPDDNDHQGDCDQDDQN